jgi:16S rRNA (adenine1518-N6/adenine1519-N6)-dimethyltransferase
MASARDARSSRAVTDAPVPALAHPRAALAALGLRAKKSFGQNFLVDRRLAAKLSELATTPPGGTVVEIGAGLGALTRELLARAARVVAIERDRDLVPALKETFSGDVAAARLAIIEADAKSADLAALFEDGPRPHVLAGNLPYQITGPLLERAVHLAPRLERAVLLVQLEVAERMTSGPGTKAYGALSVFVQAQFVAERAFTIRRGAFYPEPGVDSAVVVLTPRSDPVAESSAFRAAVRAAFGQRRKKLRNAWRRLLGANDEAVRSAAERAGIDLDKRGETLDVAAFASMARELRR